MSKQWRFRGTPFYLAEQARRLGIQSILADRAQHNPEIYRVSVLLAQLCERYHRTPMDTEGKLTMDNTERAQVRTTIDQCEQELAKLHLLAAASQVMIDEAKDAFGLEQEPRTFWVDSKYTEE